eukprot:TRINITY_DN16619_c0_g1_i3.p1 TRINITY_DN16619_c0_g1~~TRINITY_DN16619_c0_g1_i3.p1  ORF type:complete len:168 (-),score=22.78 TRINITY_DN16619_c0_g1_i3:359-817(-)
MDYDFYRNHALEATVTLFPDENALFSGLVKLLNEFDVDIIMGFETQKASLGYILERGLKCNRNLHAEISRTPADISIKVVPQEPEEKKEPKIGNVGNWNHRNRDPINVTPGLTIPGRITLNIWRIMKSELKLTSYSYQNLVFQEFQIIHHMF